MAKNKMKQVAEILGVELGEEFRISDYGDYRCRLTEHGIEVLGDKKIWVHPSYSGILNELICGVSEIKRLQWEPKKDDCYYVPDIIAVNKYRLYYYDNDDADKFFFENGFSCKTKAEAERLHDWIVEQVKNHRGNE